MYKCVLQFAFATENPVCLIFTVETSFKCLQIIFALFFMISRDSWALNFSWVYEMIWKSHENVLKTKIHLSCQNLLHVTFRTIFLASTDSAIFGSISEFFNTVKHLLQIMLNLGNGLSISTSKTQSQRDKGLESKSSEDHLFCSWPWSVGRSCVSRHFVVVRQFRSCRMFSQGHSTFCGVLLIDSFSCEVGDMFMLQNTIAVETVVCL
jgi:hypothetical protein